MENIFDREVEFHELDQELPDDMTGKTFHICTVRQEKLKDLPIGDLYWILQAFKARERNAEIVVTDFYDKPNSSNDGLRKLLGMVDMCRVEDGTDSFDPSVNFRRAEDVPRNFDVWRMFTDYVRAHSDEMDQWQSI